VISNRRSGDWKWNPNHETKVVFNRSASLTAN
jgi:hypothetical protein